jgi:hypothetical protein
MRAEFLIVKEVSVKEGKQQYWLRQLSRRGEMTAQARLLQRARLEL